jgi:hypothetical protein
MAALISFPRVSVAIDCSFGGVISPPLPDDVDECIASGSIKANGTLVVDDSIDEFDVEDRMSLRIRATASSEGSLIIESGALFEAGGDPTAEETLISDPIVIDAAGEIDNDGVLELVAAEDSIRLRAGHDILLHGDRDILDAQSVRVESKLGDIVIENAILTSRSTLLDIRASKGNITVTGSTLSSRDGDGRCRFVVGGAFIDGGGNTFNCTVEVDPQ